MARPRINQFANDLGISRSQAVSLINKGRSRKDGGSQVMERSMAEMVGPIAMPKKVKQRRKVEKFLKDNSEFYKDNPGMAKELRKNPDLLDPNHPQNKEKNKRPKLKRRGDDEPVIMAKDGKFVCRGVGAAIGGTGFSGVK